MQKDSKHKTAAAYAGGWLGAATDTGVQDLVFEEVKTLKEVFDKDAALRSFLTEPAENNLIKTEIIRETAKKCKLSEISSRTLELIAENGRLKLISMILDEFIKLYYNQKGIVRVQVQSAIELTATQDLKLKKALEKKLGAPVMVDYSINPEVLGGLCISYNSFLVDDTLEGKLKRIYQDMIKRQ